ncbi:MAG: KEOPS complex subunit Cgi121 [Methanomassiliicoccales archaeon]|nr:KEOPS complex subunit Cgi121 [Methanomassiliicoccales archaeon]
MTEITIIGARGHVDDPNRLIASLQNLERGIGIPLNADLVCGRDHLLSATLHAIRSFERGENISSNLSNEILIYASGERQFAKAVEKMGISKGSQRIAIVFLDCPHPEEVIRDLGLSHDDSVLEPTIEKLRRFGIDESEISTLSATEFADVVLERVAFVDLIKK